VPQQGHVLIGVRVQPPVPVVRDQGDDCVGKADLRHHRRIKVANLGGVHEARVLGGDLSLSCTTENKQIPRRRRVALAKTGVILLWWTFHREKKNGEGEKETCKKEDLKAHDFCPVSDTPVRNRYGRQSLPGNSLSTVVKNRCDRENKPTTVVDITGQFNGGIRKKKR
jgi:hypothetical protein